MYGLWRVISSAHTTTQDVCQCRGVAPRFTGLPNPPTKFMTLVGFRVFLVWNSCLCVVDQKPRLQGRALSRGQDGEEPKIQDPGVPLEKEGEGPLTGKVLFEGPWQACRLTSFLTKNGP